MEKERSQDGQKSFAKVIGITLPDAMAHSTAIANKTVLKHIHREPRNRLTQTYLLDFLGAKVLQWKLISMVLKLLDTHRSKNEH